MTAFKWAIPLSIVWLILADGQQTYYCKKGGTQTITGQSEGSIITRVNGTDFYGNNLRCGWRIKAGSDERLLLTVLSADLQWSPQYTTCFGYDNLEISEDVSDKNSPIASVCGARNPFNVVSRGNHLFLEFSSTHQNFGDKPGVELSFQTFKNNSCPPGWFQASDSPDECLMIGSRGKVRWMESQDVCTYSQSNLVSITSEAEYQAILEHGQNMSVSMAWIGLSDLAKDGTMVWVDTEKLEYKRMITGNNYRKHCVAQDFITKDWTTLECEKTVLHYICKAKKDGSTVLHLAIPPSNTPDSKSGRSKAFLVVLIVIIVLVVAAVIGLFFYCRYIRPGKCNDNSKSAGNKSFEAPEEPGASVNFTDLSRGASPPSAPPTEEVMLHDPQMVAPPTYEESQSHPVTPACF